MTETRVAREYDRWLGGRSITGFLYSLLTTVPGAILINTPAFRLDTTLNLQPAQRLLDVGCGRGSLLRVIGARTPFERPPVGVDISSQMLAAGSRGAATEAPIVLLRGAASALPLADESIDLALSAYMIKHLTDYELLRFFQELARVTTPGGSALIWEFTVSKSAKRTAFSRWLVSRGVRDPHFRDFEEIAAMATQGGFSWATMVNLRPFLYPPIPRVSLLVGKQSEEIDDPHSD